MPERGDDDSERARWQQIESLVDAALDLPVAERDVYLRNVCGGDAALREDVLRIIEAGERSETLPLPPISDLAAALIPHATIGERELLIRTPQRIGRYRVISELGHGGMSSVYLAERDDGEYRETVALKPDEQQQRLEGISGLRGQSVRPDTAAPSRCALVCNR